MKPLDARQLASFYMDAKERVIERGYAGEIDWQEDAKSAGFSESTFLSETAWVILSSGFRESILRRCFGEFSAAFFYWASARKIVTSSDSCREQSLEVFGNERKVDAILRIAQVVADEGIDTIRSAVNKQGPTFLQQFPFLGPVTSIHLAKNLGVPLVKPDRHLVRFAEATGYNSPNEMCQTIADVVGESLSVIDIVIWRFATLSADSNTGDRFRLSSSV